MSDTVLKPGVNIKPIITLKECNNLIIKLFGYEQATIIELNGYDDKNFHVIAKDVCDDYKNGFVLKILNSMDSKKVDFIEGQNELLLFLGERDIKCPQPVKNLQGNYYALEKLESGLHIVRLMIYLPGEILLAVENSPQLFYEVGKYVANIDNTLKKFHHPVYDTHEHLWMLDISPQLNQFVYVITNPERKSLVQNIIRLFTERVLTNKSKLSQGMIHGDFNEQNIVVNKVNGNWVVSSVLDFGDAQKSCYLYELAITMAYMIIIGKDINVGGYVLAGFLDVMPMGDFELSLLKICIMSRLCQSLVMGQYSTLQNPENATYLLTTSGPGWELLNKLYNESDEVLVDKWKLIAEKFNR